MDLIELILPFVCSAQTIVNMQACSTETQSAQCFNKFWHLQFQKIASNGQKLKHKRELNHNCCTIQSLHGEPLYSNITNVFDLQHILRTEFHPLHDNLHDWISRQITCKNPTHYEYNVEYNADKNYLYLYLIKMSESLPLLQTESLVAQTIEVQHSIDMMQITMKRKMAQVKELQLRVKQLKQVQLVATRNLRMQSKCVHMFNQGYKKGHYCQRKVKNRNQQYCCYHNH